MIKLIIYLAIAVALAYCGATVKLGKRTFFGHVQAIWKTDEVQDAKNGIKDKVGPTVDKVKRGVKTGYEEATKDDKGSGSSRCACQAVKFPLTQQLIEEARKYELRSACCHCFFWRGTACAHDWPDEGQRRWPLDAPNADGTLPTEAAFCKEFELR